jgi:threonine synthase
MTYVGLRCEACGLTATETASLCETCWGPLQAVYDLEAARASLTRASLATRPASLGRYRELLPIAVAEDFAAGVGGTPLLRAPRLAARLGVGELWIKNEGACQPTLSFKDRLVAIAAAKARELDMTILGCSSTGNLAAAVAARAASSGMRSVVFVPEGVEAAKLAAASVHGAIVVEIHGDYDRAHRLSTQVADRYGWGFVNVNLRAFYVEGGKTVGLEIAEQCGGALPGHVVVPMGGGGLLLALARAFRQACDVGLASGSMPALHGVQAAGCAPIVSAWRDGRDVRPVRPQTIVHSVAVGDPADGPSAVAVMRETGGRADAPTDEEALAGVHLLAETEGLFVETAGGLVVAAAQRLAGDGAFADGRPVVLVVTGHGLKTAEQLPPRAVDVRLDGSLASFEAFWESRGP